MKKITTTKEVKPLSKPEKKLTKIIYLKGKGDDGKTPKKGVDYFDGETPSDEKLIELITPLIPEPIPGKNGEDGKSIKGEPGEPGKPGKSFTKAQVKKMVDENIAEKMPELMSQLEGKGKVGVEENKDGYNLIIDGKKHFVPNAVYAPKLRNFVQLGDSPGTYVGGAGKFVRVNSAETGLEYATVSGSGDVLGPASAVADNVVLFDGATGKIIKDSGLALSGTNTGDQTFINPRVVTTTDDATAVIDVGVTDQYQLTAIANATTFTTTGTPVNGRSITIRLKDAGVAKALTWDTVFRTIGVTLPTTTVANKTHYIGCKYNSADSKWDVLAVGVEA